MNNSFLSGIGLANLDIGIVLLVMAIIIVILLILLIVNICSISKLKRTYKRFMRGKNSASLENEIIGLFEDNKFLKNNTEKNKKDIRTLYKRMETAYQKMGLVKYDAFKEMGGKLSFTLALLDENNNGVLLNSVHSSDGCYSYTKRIKNGDSAITLSNEEKVAVERAMQGTASNPDAE